LILTLFNNLIGKFFFNDERRYDGEWKDNKVHGQGKKRDLLILTLFNVFIGKFFWKNGNKYEGEFKNSKPNG